MYSVLRMYSAEHDLHVHPRISAEILLNWRTMSQYGQDSIRMQTDGRITTLTKQDKMQDTACLWRGIEQEVYM